MSKKILSIIIGIIFLSSLSGCGSPAPIDLSSTFHDELNGLNTIEQDVKKGDFESAEVIADRLDDEFYDVVLPHLKEKEGESSTEGIYNDWEDLQEALIEEENEAITINLIKVNRDNLAGAANALGVTLKQ